MTIRNAPAVTAALTALAVAILGGLMTDIGPWYVQLQKPAWQPPDWVFGPVWTTIYVLTAAAGVKAWNATPLPDARRLLLILFLLNATLNVLWSLLFFRLHRPDWAFYEIFVLWASIVLLMVVCMRRSATALVLLVPYVSWVSFAAVLNYEIVRLNRPFTGM